ncbi:MAG: Crp/Fnr family transcriptional regulator [Deltaproteobacteria bacterium]|nr:Crp/Fnr family transcriptional regulator [Deltaproteobacteria bacterium]
MGQRADFMDQAENATEPVVDRALNEQLAAFPLFAGLPPESLSRLAGSGVPRFVRQDESVLQQGEPSPSLFIVLSGRLKMTRSLSNGRSVLLALFNPGDLVGIAPGLGGGPSDSTVEALESSLCLEVSRQSLLTAMGERPQFLGELLPILTRRVAECNNCAVEATFFRVEPRFARLFLRLAESVGQPRDGATFIPVRLSRQDLADMAGTTIETSIRILSRWGKEGVVETIPGGFLIRDQAPLARLCGD